MLTAFINENLCIGCNKCALICPTATIIGALEHTYTVFEAACIACNKCITQCPVDCISMQPRTQPRDPLLIKNFVKNNKTYKTQQEQQQLKLFTEQNKYIIENNIKKAIE